MEEKYGEVEEMNVCDNLGDHLVGNVYVKVREFAVCLHCNNFILIYCLKPIVIVELVIKLEFQTQNSTVKHISTFLLFYVLFSY